MASDLTAPLSRYHDSSAKVQTCGVGETPTAAVKYVACAEYHASPWGFIMDYFLEYMFWFTLLFRWVILVLGTGLIIYSFKRTNKYDGLKSWIYFAIFVIVLFIGSAIFHIAWFDFGIRF